ncbi:MAG: MBOAT family protein [Candidatus Omnitrophica bacterium]|nr:MBOAT family protein [Candidatus Omnitrophota bacterium]
MLFNSLEFFIFFIVVYSTYLLFSHGGQNRLLLVASYIFYGWWDWRFLSLLLLSTIVDYVCAIKIEDAPTSQVRKKFLLLSICFNLSLLGFFKYFNFFISSFEALLANLGIAFHPWTLKIILPVGISFYTFQTMSYVIDIYRRDLKPARNFLDFALYVSYFPQLVAGPIERAAHLLPQVLRPRRVTLEQFYQGCYLLFWGLFQKVVIADNLAKVVDPIFASPPPYDGLMVLLATYAFAFQIFCDFAGYSDMARGLGKMMGFDIMVNFNLPYFATNAREFWQRWHISLSTWLRDYLYISLGGNRQGEKATYRNLMITMLLGGLWHGANWTFVVWGAFHGLLLIIHRAIEPSLKKLRLSSNIILENIFWGVRVIFFFHLVCLGWLFFRAPNLSQALDMLTSVLTAFHWPTFQNLLDAGLFFILALLLVQILQYRQKNLLFIFEYPAWIRGTFYFVIWVLILTFGVTGGKAFIYFQF